MEFTASMRAWPALSGGRTPFAPPVECTQRVTGVAWGGHRGSRNLKFYEFDAGDVASKLRHRASFRGTSTPLVRTEQRPSHRRVIVLHRCRVGIIRAHRVTRTFSTVVFVVVAVEGSSRVRTNPSRFARTRRRAWRHGSSHGLGTGTISTSASRPPRDSTVFCARCAGRARKFRVRPRRGVASRAARRLSRRRGRWRTRFSSSRSNARFLRRTFCVREGARMSVTSALASRTSFLPCEMEMRSGWAGNRAP